MFPVPSRIPAPYKRFLDPSQTFIQVWVHPRNIFSGDFSNSLHPKIIPISSLQPLAHPCSQKPQFLLSTSFSQSLSQIPFPAIPSIPHSLFPTYRWDLGLFQPQEFHDFIPYLPYPSSDPAALPGSALP